MNVLVIDPHRELSEVIKGMFEDWSTGKDDVEWFGSGNAAVSHFDKNSSRYQLVVVNHYLEDVPANTLIHAVRKKNPSQRIVVTASEATAAMRSEFAKLGVAVFEKGERIKVLWDLIQG